MLGVWHWLLHLSGADNVSGPWYGFWSGFGSDLGEAALIGAAAAVIRRHQCHVKRCWRVQWRRSGHHQLCREHHPDDPPRADQL